MRIVDPSELFWCLPAGTPWAPCRESESSRTNCMLPLRGLTVTISGTFFSARYVKPTPSVSVPGDMKLLTSIFSVTDLYPFDHWLRRLALALYDQFFEMAHPVLRLKMK